MTFYFFSLVGRRDVTVIRDIPIKLKLILNYLNICCMSHRKVYTVNKKILGCFLEDDPKIKIYLR